jgi:hypothetical protein
MMSEALQELGATIALKKADAVQATAVAFGELTVTANLAHLESLANSCATMRPAGSRPWSTSPPSTTPSGWSGSTWCFTSCRCTATSASG